MLLEVDIFPFEAVVNKQCLKMGNNQVGKSIYIEFCCAVMFGYCMN